MAHKFLTHKTETRGEGRELYKTPPETIIKIVKDILLYDPSLKERLWIDPCAADGIWEKSTKDLEIKWKSYDIYPLDDIVIQQDFYEMQPQENIFIIGNPPFKQLKKFIKKSFELTDKCYFLGGSAGITGSLAPKVEMLHRFENYDGNQKDKRSKLCFTTTNDEYFPIWCCGAIFNKNLENPKFEDGDGFAVSILHKKSLDDKRIRVIQK